MDRYDELIKSLENYKKLLDEALVDLAKENDCQNCANINECSSHRIERNLAYGGCAKWQWHGASEIIKAS